MGSIWRLVRPLRHPVRPLRHPVRHLRHLLTAGPSTIEPTVPIVAPLGAQDTPSVIQRATPVVVTEQTMQSTPGYGTLPYCRLANWRKGGSKCYNISSFRNGSSLRLGELAEPSLSLVLSPPLVLRGFQLRLRTMLRSFQ